MQREGDPSVSDLVIEPLSAAPAVHIRLLGADDVRVGPASRAGEASGVDVEVTVIDAYDEFAGRLRAFAIRATRDSAVADDVVQEAFLRLVVHLRAGPPPDNVGAWLYRVVANLIVSGGRRRSVADRMKWRLLHGDMPPTPEEHALGSERDRTLALALSRLPADARVAVLLAARGMGALEIGLVINRTPAATRTYLCRARLKLRDALNSLNEDGLR